MPGRTVGQISKRVTSLNPGQTFLAASLVFSNTPKTCRLGATRPDSPIPNSTRAWPFWKSASTTARITRRYWQWGWTGGYGLGIVVGVGKSISCCSNKKSGPANSVKKKRNEQRVTHIVTAVKGAIGTSRMLLSRHPGRHGADAMRAIEGDSRDAKLARLAKGEEILQDVAKSAERRWSWKAHAGNIGLNLAGAGFIFGFGRESDAWESLGVGIGVGTLQILSAPKRGIQDLNDYETRFGMKTADRFNWSIVPTMGGAALQVTF